MGADAPYSGRCATTDEQAQSRGLTSFAPVQSETQRAMDESWTNGPYARLEPPEAIVNIAERHFTALRRPEIFPSPRTTASM